MSSGPRKGVNLSVNSGQVHLTVPGGMGGERAIAELKKLDPSVKAIVCSGYSQDPVMANYAEYDFVGVMPKPYSASQMADLLHRLLQQKN